MKTPPLFDVPKDSPTRHDLLAQFKREHGIETFHSKHMAREDLPWSATHMKSAREIADLDEQATMMECIAHAVSRLEDARVIIYGRTEREAIFELCKGLNIVCDL